MRKAAIPDHIWTVMELIRWGTDYFKTKHVDSPRLTIELMLCSILDVSRVSLYTQFERPLIKDELDRLRALVERRVKHEPLQYILRETYFYGLKLRTDSRALIPRPETEILVDRAIQWCMAGGRTSLNCLDIGTGSGCIPIAIALHVEGSRWLCVDNDIEALTLAAENSSLHSLTDRIKLHLLNFREQVPEGVFDLITMNPPYIPPSEIVHLQNEVKFFEPLQALTDDSDGLHFYRRLSDVAHQILANDGVILVEVGYDQASAVAELFEEAGYKTTVIKDLSGIDRVVQIEHSKVINT